MDHEELLRRVDERFEDLRKDMRGLDKWIEGIDAKLDDVVGLQRENKTHVDHLRGSVKSVWAVIVTAVTSALLWFANNWPGGK